MKKIIAAALLSLSFVPLAAAADKPAMSELLRAAGIEFAPPVATPAAVPVGMTAPGAMRASGPALERLTMGCVLDLTYTERLTQLAVLRVWKELNGEGVLRCPDMPALNLLVRAEGLALRPVSAVDAALARENGEKVAQLNVRVPHLFAPKHAPGSYHKAGGEALAADGPFTPWVNADGTLATTLYLPASFGAGSGVALDSLTLRLAR